MKTKLQVRAARFARDAHKGQNRKYTGLPYIHHPMQVAILTTHYLPISKRFDEAVAAAWLHDVVEDCGVKLHTIVQEFGAIVAEFVFYLSDVSKKEDGNRAARKQIDRWHIAGGPSEAHTIKCCDLIDNLTSITQYDPDFAKVYMSEKKLLLPLLNRAEQRVLDSCWKLVQDYEQQQLDEALRRH